MESTLRCKKRKQRWTWFLPVVPRDFATMTSFSMTSTCWRTTQVETGCCKKCNVAGAVLWQWVQCMGRPGTGAESGSPRAKLTSSRDSRKSCDPTRDIPRSGVRRRHYRIWKLRQFNDFPISTYIRNRQKKITSQEAA